MREPKDIVLLVVDDEDTLRKLIVRDFQRKGYNVLSARNGIEAFALVQANAIDVVLSDVRMPQGDGIELLKRIKDLSPLTPVFMFVTGRADMTLEEAFDWGADAVFDKPFDRAALFQAVADAVSSRDDRWKVRAPRQEVDATVTLRHPSLPPVAGKAWSVARGGMLVSLVPPLPWVGARVGFTIERGAPPTISGTGIVRWVRAAGPEDDRNCCGIEFVELDDASRAHIIELIDSLLPRAFIPRM